MSYRAVAAPAHTGWTGTRGRGRRSRAWGRWRRCLACGRGRSRALGLLLLLSGGILLVELVVGDVVLVSTIGSVRVSTTVVLGNLVDAVGLADAPGDCRRRS
jgi:hypothetical protein